MTRRESAPPINADTLPSLLAERAQGTPASPAQWALGQNGAWRATSWRDYFNAASRAASLLRGLGLKPGDHIGIMAPSRVEWDIAQMGALAAGATVVGIDMHEHDARLAEMLDMTHLTALVVSEESVLARLPVATRHRLRFVISLAPVAGASGAVHWDTLMERAFAGAEWVNHASPDDHALIVFTSGTTGAPKAIAYTHRQVCLACDAILEAFSDIEAGSRLACWLPLSNLFQRMINFCAIARGGETYYVADPRDIMRHVPRIAPQVFLAVPRFYEKFHAGIQERVQSGPRWRRRLFDMAMDNARTLAVARHTGSRRSLLRRLTHALLDALVLRRVRAVLGGHIRFLVSGSAPMPNWLLENFDALGMPVYEAYGMSENIVPISANRPGAVKPGSVGKPLRHNRIRIAEDGELLVRGPGVFSGYLGEPPAARTADGYFPSGDYAQQDVHGFITLTGRKSEIFKTSTGRRIAPVGIENRITRLPYVEQAVVIGANQPLLIAIAWIASDRFVAEGGLLQAAVRIRADVRAAVAELPDYQQPAGLILSGRMPAIGRGEMTSNLKLRRKQIETNYAAEIEQLYRLLQNKSENSIVVIPE